MEATALNEEIKRANLPHTVKIHGRTLRAIGRGRFPYDCRIKDKHPNSMIYEGSGYWTCEHAADFIAHRDRNSDQF